MRFIDWRFSKNQDHLLMNNTTKRPLKLEYKNVSDKFLILTGYDHKNLFILDSYNTTTIKLHQ